MMYHLCSSAVRAIAATVLVQQAYSLRLGEDSSNYRVEDGAKAGHLATAAASSRQADPQTVGQMMVSALSAPPAVGQLMTSSYDKKAELNQIIAGAMAKAAQKGNNEAGVFTSMVNDITSRKPGEPVAPIYQSMLENAQQASSVLGTVPSPLMSSEDTSAVGIGAASAALLRTSGLPVHALTQATDTESSFGSSTNSYFASNSRSSSIDEETLKEIREEERYKLEAEQLKRQAQESRRHANKIMEEMEHSAFD